MRITPVGSENIKNSPQTEKISPAAVKQEHTRPSDEDSIRLSGQAAPPEQVEKSGLEEKVAEPLQAGGKVQKQSQPAIPAYIAEFPEEYAASRAVLDISKIREKEEPFLRLSKLSEKEYKVQKEEYYRDLFADRDLQGRTEDVVHKWALGGGWLDRLRESYSNVVLSGKPAESEMDKTLVDLLTTRGERWARLSDRLGIKPPSSFHAYRGVTGDYAVSAVIKAWSDDKSKYMNIPNHELSSWSLDRKVAEDFSESGSKTPSVIYEAEIPFSRTLMDKWVDDNSFISSFYGEEEVVVAATKDGIRIPKDQATVSYRGKTYTYENRQELIRAYQAGNTGFLSKISQAIHDKFYELIG